MGIARRDFMKGVGGLVGSVCLASVGEKDCHREVGWSEGVEVEARLRNEVGDLVDEKMAGIYLCKERYGCAFFKRTDMFYGENIPFDVFVAMKEKLLSAEKRTYYYRFLTVDCDESLKKDIIDKYEFGHVW